MAPKFPPILQMKREYPPLAQLTAEYGAHKEIPGDLREVILKALFHFPELRETRIEFRLTEQGEFPHETQPSVARLLVPGAKRGYTVSLLTRATSPTDQALILNLPYEAQVAAIAHELAHILQYESKGAGGAIRLSLQGGDAERTSERQADISVIEHGLGFELYTYAAFIRKIKGYLEARPDIDVNRLHPNEILEALPPDQLHELPRF
jgi:hypothetical protein